MTTTETDEVRLQMNNPVIDAWRRYHGWSQAEAYDRLCNYQNYDWDEKYSTWVRSMWNRLSSDETEIAAFKVGRTDWKDQSWGYRIRVSYSYESGQARWLDWLNRQIAERHRQLDPFREME